MKEFITKTPKREKAVKYEKKIYQKYMLIIIKFLFYNIK